jgi:hypothetical protein
MTTWRAAGLLDHFFGPCKYGATCYPECVVITRRGCPKAFVDCMFDMMVMGILGGLAALVAFEIYQEVRGSSKSLEDRYHE